MRYEWRPKDPKTLRPLPVALFWDRFGMNFL